MELIKISWFATLIALGAFFVFYGGWDDSPGLQLIGVLITFSGLYGLIKTWLKKTG